MLAINYLGEVNNPNGLPGLYDQVLRMYRRVTQSYMPDLHACQNSPGTWYSRPTGNMVGNCKILPYLRSSRSCYF
eukprot:5889018-Pleurochrysis_carterae.AAC.1